MDSIRILRRRGRQGRLGLCAINPLSLRDFIKSLCTQATVYVDSLSASAALAAAASSFFLFAFSSRSSSRSRRRVIIGDTLRKACTSFHRSVGISNLFTIMIRRSAQR